MNASPPRRPTLLLILDGVGLNTHTENNALYLADTPNLDRYFAHYPHTRLYASGPSVGLPEGQMGNSEVGHMTIGAGTILRQDLVRIDDAIADGSFYDNPVLLTAAERAVKAGRPLHLLGLVSAGGVHSHIRHLYALIEFCRRQKIPPVLHMITDGRDTPPRDCLSLLDSLENRLSEAGGYVATISGRYYAMDRDKRWDRTRMAWEAMCFGRGDVVSSAQEAVEGAYAQDKGDEFIPPSVIDGADQILAGDQVVFFNFRNDRARQLTYVLAGQDFKPFDRNDFEPVRLTCLTEYDPQLELPIMFPPEFPKATLASTVSQAGIAQFHSAETEKYAHVTFFLNGGREHPFPGEVRHMVPSPDVATYDLAPEMSAAALADVLIEAIEANEYGFIVANFANGDMVGHTAVRAAVIRAVEALDREVGRVLDAAVASDYSVILTADHGNCDEMVDPVTGQPHTQHTTHPVPLMVIDQAMWALRDHCGLSNIAPTVLALMGLETPRGMTADSILLRPLDVPLPEQEDESLKAFVRRAS